MPTSSSGTGRAEQALERLERAFAAVASDEPDDDIAALASRLAQTYAIAGQYERAAEPNELALRVAQAQRLPEALIRALMTKALLARASDRPEEQLALLRHALRLALEHDLPESASVAYGNLSDACFFGDRYREALEVLEEALAHARRVGDRRNELYLLSETSYALAMTGSWNEALAAFAEIPEDQLPASAVHASVVSGVLEIYLHRGQLANAQELLSLFADLERTAEGEDAAIYAGARAAVHHAAGHHADALKAGMQAAGLAPIVGAGQQGVKQGLVSAVDAALSLGEREPADELLASIETLPAGLRSPFLEAHAQRFRARMNDEEAGFKTAAAGFREYNFPFWLAVTELEHGEWLAAHGRSSDGEPMVAEAREIFERLEAEPWLERASRAGAQAAEVAS